VHFVAIANLIAITVCVKQKRVAVFRPTINSNNLAIVLGPFDKVLVL
jgi:hypothetical protein